MTLFTSPLVALLLRTTLLLGLALLAVCLLRRRGPAVQTLAGRAALAAVALLLLTAPLTQFVPPLWDVPAPVAPRPTAPVSTARSSRGLCARPSTCLPTTPRHSRPTPSAVLAHELAHADRHDTRWTLASRLLCALLWPQPLLWLLCRKLDHVSEDACDLAVLSHACPPRVYADCLLTLAERRPLSRRTSPLTASVVPFRSQIGKRIVRVLNASSRLSAPPSRVFRLGVVFCAVFGACGAVLLLNAGAKVEMPHFAWAKQQGWTVRPVQVIDLDHPGLVRVSSLPYKITDEDKAVLNQLNPGDVIRIGPMKNQTKAKAEAVLSTHPRFFYVEYLLSQWFRQHGDTAHADALFSQSLHDAPVILAGRYEYDDGTPLVGFHFSTAIICYNPNHLEGSNSNFRSVGVTLPYGDVITDSDGCFYLPVFQAIYSQNGILWSPDRLNQLTATRFKAHSDLITPGPFLSGIISDEKSTRLYKGFVAKSRVAVLPSTKVRPRINLSAPFNKVTGSDRKPIMVNGSGLRIFWKPYPRADHYVVTVNEYQVQEKSAQWNETQVTSKNPSRLGLPLTQPYVTLDFRRSNPVFNHLLTYSISVRALDKQGELVSNSEECFFQPVNASFPLPLTKAALAQALGPGFQVVSIKTEGKSVIAEALSPPGFQLTPAASDALSNSGKSFGLAFGGWSSKPGLSTDQNSEARSIHIVYSRQ